MRKQDHLSALIGSLTPSEKRYFKLYAGLQPGPKRYMKLYEVLETESKYEPGAICKKLKITPKKLADEKEYLQQVLLRALRNFEQDANPKITLIHHFLEADMLNRRGMNEFALSHLDKMYEKTILHEQYATFINYFQLRQNLVQNRADPSPELVSPELYKRQVAQMNELFEMKFIFSEFLPHLVNYTNFDSFKAFGDRALMQKKQEDLLSAQAMIIWNDIKSYIALVTDWHGPDAAMYATNAIKVYDKAPGLKQIMPQAYVSAHVRLAEAYPIQESTKGMAMLDRAISIIDSKEVSLYHKPAAQLRYQALSHRLVLLHRESRYPEANETAKQLLKHELPLNRLHLRWLILYKYSVGLLLTGQVDEALIPLREVLTGNKKVRSDVQLSAMLLELMVQYDLGNYSLIPYSIKSIRKWIDRKGISPDDLNFYLKWMLRIGAAAESGKPAKELKAFLDEINKGELKIDPGRLNVKYWLRMKLKTHNS